MDFGWAPYTPKTSCLNLRQGNHGAYDAASLKADLITHVGQAS